LSLNRENNKEKVGGGKASTEGKKLVGDKRVIHVNMKHANKKGEIDFMENDWKMREIRHGRNGSITSCICNCQKLLG